MKKGVLVGEAAVREAAARIIDQRSAVSGRVLFSGGGGGGGGIHPPSVGGAYGGAYESGIGAGKAGGAGAAGTVGTAGTAGVPLTALVAASHPVFHIAHDAKAAASPGRPSPLKVGSLQAYVKHDATAEDVSSSIFPVEEVHRIGLLDLRLLNIDRHHGNILVHTAKNPAPTPADLHRAGSVGFNPFARTGGRDGGDRDGGGGEHAGGLGPWGLGGGLGNGEPVRRARCESYDTFYDMQGGGAGRSASNPQRPVVMGGRGGASFGALGRGMGRGGGGGMPGLALGAPGIPESNCLDSTDPTGTRGEMGGHERVERGLRQAYGELNEFNRNLHDNTHPQDTTSPPPMPSAPGVMGGMGGVMGDGFSPPSCPGSPFSMAGDGAGSMGGGSIASSFSETHSSMYGSSLPGGSLPMGMAGMAGMAGSMGGEGEGGGEGGGRGVRGGAASQSRITLIPIDHGFSLPAVDTLEEVTSESFAWLGWKQAHQPFSPAVRAMIRGLDAQGDIEAIQAALAPESLAAQLRAIGQQRALNRAAEALRLAQLDGPGGGGSGNGSGNGSGSGSGGGGDGGGEGGNGDGFVVQADQSTEAAVLPSLALPASSITTLPVSSAQRHHHNEGLRLRRECLMTLRVTTLVLQRAEAAGLTLFEMGCLMCRHGEELDDLVAAPGRGGMGRLGGAVEAVEDEVSPMSRFDSEHSSSPSQSLSPSSSGGSSGGSGGSGGSSGRGGMKEERDATFSSASSSSSSSSLSPLERWIAETNRRVGPLVPWGSAGKKGAKTPRRSGRALTEAERSWLLCLGRVVDESLRHLNTQGIAHSSGRGASSGNSGNSGNSGKCDAGGGGRSMSGSVASVPGGAERPPRIADVQKSIAAYPWEGGAE